MRKTRETRNCKVCDKPFETHQYLIKKGYGVTCSSKCRGALMIKSESNCKCATCGKEFRKRPDRLFEKNYCSEKCSRAARVGAVFSDESRKRMSESAKGKIVSEETRMKISIANSAKRPWQKSRSTPQSRAIVSAKLKGRPKSQETVAKIIATKKAFYDRVGRKTSENIRIRKSKEYSLWRTAVYQRDSYACVWCGKIGGRLNADHIKPFSKYPALRFAIDNGRTLCEPCHMKTDTFGGKSINK
jgi:5-methylcytosine-specific restriction endonuclease McrA